MNELQRDFGRVEARVEIIGKDVESIKADLAEIKGSIIAQNAVKTSDWKRLTVVGLLASIATHIFNWVRPFIT